MSRPGFQKIQGKGIDLIEIAPSYFEQVVGWRNDPENRRCFFSHHPWTLEGQRRWYEKYLADPSDLTFVITLKNGLPIGTVALYSIDEQRGSVEFGRLLIGDRVCKGRGRAKEATTLCVSLAFDRLHLKQVSLEVYEWNTAAIGIYKQNGFAVEEIVTQQDPENKVVRMKLERQAICQNA